MCCSILSSLDCWELFTVGFCVVFVFLFNIFNHYLFLFEHFFIFWHYKILKAHLVYAMPSSARISHCSKVFQFSFLENNTRNQDLGSKCDHCWWDVDASRFLGDRTRKYMYTNSSIDSCA